MNTIKQISRLTLIIYISLLNNLAFSQTKIKTPATSKPSKQTTIKYIIEKLNENCTGITLEERETLFNTEKTPILSYYKYHYYTNYTVEEKDGTALIVISIAYKVKKTDYSGGENWEQNHPIIVKIPVNKINDIVFATVEKKVTNKSNDLDEIIQEGYRAGLFLMKSNNIMYSQTDQDIVKKLPAFNIPIFDTEIELKLKKAILNLQSFYPIGNDPFEE